MKWPTRCGQDVPMSAGHCTSQPAISQTRLGAVILSETVQVFARLVAALVSGYFALFDIADFKWTYRR
jgi:hypothetical protein